jgi:hypothetical protein
LDVKVIHPRIKKAMYLVTNKEDDATIIEADLMSKSAVCIMGNISFLFLGRYFQGNSSEVTKNTIELCGSLPKTYKELEMSGANFYKKFSQHDADVSTECPSVQGWPRNRHPTEETEGAPPGSN